MPRPSITRCSTPKTDEVYKTYSSSSKLLALKIIVILPFARLPDGSAHCLLKP